MTIEFFNSIFNRLLISQRYNFICFFQPCDTVEIAEQLPASPLPPKSDVPAKFFSSNSSSSIKEVEVPDENVRQSPIGAETSDEELHANLVGDDQDYRNRYDRIDRPNGCSEFMGKTFQAAQLTHERFSTIDHSCKRFF